MGIAKLLYGEVGGDADLFNHPNHEDLLATSSSKQSQGSCDGRLTDATFAGDKNELAIEHPRERSGPWRCSYRGAGVASLDCSEHQEVVVAQIDVEEFLDRFRARAEAVKDRGIPPLEGEARKMFVQQAEKDYLDYSLVGGASWSTEDGYLVLRIELA